MLLKWRLKIRNFFKKYKRVIFIVAIVWLIIIAINYLLGHKKEEITLNTTYNPHEVLLTSETDVPEKLKTPIEDTIDDYVNKCNNKDYSGAFELLTADCKTHVFGDSLDNFTTYASSIFTNKKRYSIQNYSNYGQAYIYNIKLIDDIITTGLTNQSYAYYEEKMAIKEENGQIKLNVNDYMGYSELKRVAEDDYLKIRIESKEEFYSMEIYSIKITNKTDNKVVLYDGIVGNELSLISESDERTEGRTGVYRSFLQVQFCGRDAGLDPQGHEGRTQRAGGKDLRYHARKHHQFPEKCGKYGKGKLKNFLRKSVSSKNGGAVFLRRNREYLLYKTARLLKSLSFFMVC